MSIFSFLQRRKQNSISKEQDTHVLAEIPHSPVKCVQVLGFGDEKCDMLVAATTEALRRSAMTDLVELITDMGQIADRGIMITPALVVDGIIVSFGRVLQVNEIIKILQKVR